MILQLSNRYAKGIAWFFYFVFCSSLILPYRAKGEGNVLWRSNYSASSKPVLSHWKIPNAGGSFMPTVSAVKNHQAAKVSDKLLAKKKFSGGPSQPEMSSFKSVGAENMVNLFTGDFSYNIPLMDVGGYPLNIYYSGGISMEQEASWVGLGWNINPGNINRNVRGVPDDFNGDDILTETQMIKSNKTWGLGVGGDVELFGIKAPIHVGLGVAFNNYLGPSLDLSLRGQVGLKISQFAGFEKSAGSAEATVGIDINSRAGTSFTGSVGLNAIANNDYGFLNFGVGLSTGYNSRSGIQALQIYSQRNFNYSNATSKGEAHDINESQTLTSTSISFSKPSYIPSLRMPLTNTAWSGQFQMGLGFWGIQSDVQMEVYGQKSEIVNSDVTQYKHLVGYLYYQNANNHPDYIVDFTRFNDREVTPNTPVVSVPQYSYDVFSIQGEGTGGTIRPYRNDLGYVRDNTTTSKDGNFGLGVDIGIPGHYGSNFNLVKTPSTVGEWNNGNKLRNSISFTSSSGTFENVYFKNPGENCVVDPNRLNQVGGTDLVRFALGGSNNSPTIEPQLQRFGPNTLKAGSPNINLTQTPVISQRNKRTQVVNFLTAGEASVAGLDKIIKSYNIVSTNGNFFDNTADTLLYTSIARVGSYRLAHHISQINVTEGNGKRYVYGLPVYNTTQKDFTFSVNPPYAQIPDQVTINPTDPTTGSFAFLNTSKVDGYLQVRTTPAYAHSFLLSGILSPDYVDVTGNGISEDDLGEAVKFNYTKIAFGIDTVHKWRTPLGSNTANFNAGLRSEKKDDKGIISYGERESWYLHSAESKTMIALFYLSSRNDGKGVVDSGGIVAAGDTLLRKLDSIALYNKSDLKKNGLTGAQPIKTVHFHYSYALCSGTPDNLVSGGGKLTLDSLWFTYNGKTRAFKNKYIFNYGSNQTYSFAASDKWGNYKPQSLNPSGLRNADYPYTIQDTTSKSTLDQNAAAWILNKIIMPAGGEIDVSYESDDYAYVQNKRASDMMQIVGFGNTNTYSSSNNNLYNVQSSGENDYVFIQVPVTCTNRADVLNKYLSGVSQMAFKIWVNMPKGPEYITCYAGFNDYGVDVSHSNIIWIKMNRLAGKSPLSLTTLEYLRQQLPGQAFPGYDVSESSGLSTIGDMLVGMLSSLETAFSDPVNAFRARGLAMHTDLTKCFARLNDPDGFKYGGGYRVKTVVLKDNWDSMTLQNKMSYGKRYDYTTTENFQGQLRRISSGVASYEPSIGGEENPWQTIIQVEDDLPAGPSSFGAVEMPVLDAFFPAATVGYSKVTVTAIPIDSSGTKKTRSGIGKQVTEFYTAKDFPVSYGYTPFDAASVKEFHQSSSQAFLFKYANDFKAQSQGFLVATNDMHGKLKSQSSYAENDTSTRISYTENFYKNTGVNGLNDQFNFISNAGQGSMFSGNIGIDVDLMTDAREFTVKSSSLEIQSQTDLLFLLEAVIPIPTMWPVIGTSQNSYRAVTTTKVINFHGVLDSVVVIDKGSQVSTKNLAYDGETGEVLVTRTNNEFNQPVYNTSYPAYWAYGGMGLAYKNIDAVYSGVTFSQGRITAPSGFDQSVFESGDELLILASTAPTSGCDQQIASGPVTLVWAVDTNKNKTSLITTPSFIFQDSSGRPYTTDSANFRIIRSGHRNMLDAKAETVTSLANPFASGKLAFDTTTKVVNASAVEFREKWRVDNDVFGHFRLIKNYTTCKDSLISDSLGFLEKSINPYRKGLLGNFKPFRTMVFYNDRKEYDTSANTNISINGQLNNFKLYWDLNTSNNLVPDVASTQWVWNSKLNRTNAKGLELETQNALGIYTSAQYGYQKTLPVAITDNAMYGEMFAENFEDYGYAESINNTSYNFLNRYVDFSHINSSYILNTDNSNFKAHTGKYVLAVNGPSSALTIPVLTLPDTTSFVALNYLKDTVRVLNDQGGNYSFTPTTPSSYLNTGTTIFSTTHPGLQISIIPTDQYTAGTGGNPGTRTHFYSMAANFYINITDPGTYSFLGEMSTSYNENNVTLHNHSNGMTVDIWDTLGNLVNVFNLSQYQNGFNDTAQTYSVHLCAGIYQVTFSSSELYSASDNGSTESNNVYSWSCTNSSSPDYKNLNKVNGCIFTEPVSASLPMENPLFTMPAGKPMLFSGWVHENCGDPANGISCKDFTYTHNQVQLKFDNGSINDVTLYPTGPIVDGWQRYEGTVQAPSNAASMTMTFVNSGTGTIYFDDIRMQPLNANMKGYVYDPVNQRLVAELDPNNYASFYEYDEEGKLIRTKVETKQGIKTVTETRSELQRIIH